MTPTLTGFRVEPEAEAERHWSYDRLRARVDAELPAGELSSLASDLRPDTSPRHDQRATSSCVAQAVVKALEIKRIQKHGRAAHVDLSRLAVYYLARELMSPPETARDEGTYVSLAADVLRRFGICAEADWPFDEGKLSTPPSWRAMRKAYVHKIAAWYRITSAGQDRVEDVIANLAVGNPVCYGTRVGDNWVDYQAGQVIRPVEGVIRGGHATVLVGWQPDLHGGVFLGENSWGSGFGDDGFYMLSPEVVASAQSADFHVVAGGWEPWAT